MSWSKEKFESLGWGIFVLSAILYIVSGIRAGDLISTLAGVLFLLACFVFLLPAIRDKLRVESTG